MKTWHKGLLAAAAGSIFGTVLLRLFTVLSWHLIMPPPKGNFEIWTWNLKGDIFVYFAPGAWGLMIGAAAGLAIFLYRTNRRDRAGWLCALCGSLISIFLVWRLIWGTYNGFDFDPDTNIFNNAILRDTILVVSLPPFVCALVLLMLSLLIRGKNRPSSKLTNRCTGRATGSATPSARR